MAVPRQGRLFYFLPKPGLEDRLQILSEDSRFDLAGSCAKDPFGRGRRRGSFGRWVYPVVLPSGRRLTLFRTLLSNVCVNDCAYCPLRLDQDPPRVSLSPKELVQAFMAYFRRGLVQGLFLSSGVIKDPDTTMDLLLQTAHLLRHKEGYRGYLHLKVIPGASPEAVEEAAKLADALSLNLEAPSPERFRLLCQRKSFKAVTDLTRKLAGLKEKFSFAHTTQLVVGAAGETDLEIIRTTEALYRRWGLNRVYFSAYQPGCGASGLPGEELARKIDLRLREHRLYQVDFLLRRYGFSAGEIPVKNGFLPLDIDPKTAWARKHPEFFPVNVNRASYKELLRVPGIGPTLAKRILSARRQARLRSLAGLVPEHLWRRAKAYLCF